MKILDKLSPNRLFRSRSSKSRSVSRSEPPSFGSGSSSSSSSSSIDKPSKAGGGGGGGGTPRSVLPSEMSGDWADLSGDMGPGVHRELVQAFRLIDRDGDGKITRQELASVLRRVGPGSPSESELLSMLAEVDRDGDGCISLEELGAVAAEALAPACAGSELRGIFDFFDCDGDGRITAEELLHFFETVMNDDRCTLEDCRRMIDGVNQGGDGFVCFEDFARMMELQPQT